MSSRTTGSFRSTRVAASRLALGAASALGVLGVTQHADAQIAGTANRPLPNVLLLVDTSGSMERMPDNSLPIANRGVTMPVSASNPGNACSPGVESNPNRWGMLVQALTGNIQPFFSCEAVSRSGNAFKNEFRIGGTAAPNLPYDKDYFLPYHRPLGGSTALDACAVTPVKLPGAIDGSGVGPSGGGAGGDSADFPADAFAQVKNAYMTSMYGSTNGSPLSLSAANTCTFGQADDGQLDATKDYVRFGLMTFDNDTSNLTGVAGNPPGGAVNTANPFAGQWSYVKSPGNGDPLGIGLPAGCGTPPYPFEVGARHWAAPPWEGRMIRFPTPNARLYELARNNEQIQQVLLGTRPYGATPIDGMMEDARDYLWFNPQGPNGASGGPEPALDPYVTGGCRDQYIILLTDGAPNLDLRPSCEGAGGVCPYPNKAAQVADMMARATGGRKVRTYVIGFSVNGAENGDFTNDGFPTPDYASPKNNCKAWYNGVTNNGANPINMHNICSGALAPGQPKPPKGSTADACCQLSEIAYYGDSTNSVGPFFAETQADLVLSFGRILGGISKAATTRTIPGYAPATSISGVGVTADYIASFIPNAQKVWSGEIDRSRSRCVGPLPQSQGQSAAAGDSFAQNTAIQAAAGRRMFVSVKAQPSSGVAPYSGTVIDSARTIRPFAVGTDGIPASTGRQVDGLDMALAAETDWDAALQIDDTTCKRSRATSGQTIPRLGKAECKNVIWGFTTAHSSTNSPLTYSGYDFNARCKANASTTQGFCSVTSTQQCLVSASGCPTGEVCVPECSALGAIYRSSPTLVGPPNELLRDDGYRAFSEQRKQRRPAMFVATTDGMLHAFKALSTIAPGDPAFDAVAGEHELWSFVPPAVLPRLASNYPTGQQILLDGTPTVRDVVWDSNGIPALRGFHTTLVAGMGAGGGGYYALNVTDVDCQGPPPNGIGVAPNGCLGSIPDLTNLNQVAAADARGPQFLWQLTDVESAGATDPGKPTRESRDGKKFVALFGRESGNAAIATIQANIDNTTPRQVGVAILTGGIDGPPIANETCPRAINGGAQTAFLPANFDASDDATPMFPRTSVRRWATGGADPCRSKPVPGRSVTIVNIATGEVIRHFGRLGQDVPARLAGRTINSPFDSPVIGTPVVYPNTVGLTAQKVFVGDADGTLWRINISSPNPDDWSVQLFQDVLSRSISTPATPGGLDSQPIQIAPVLSLDPSGGLVVNAATGDQENVVASAERNYVISVQEGRALSTTVPGRALVRWYKQLDAAERVTGPMTVFDRTLYFATYKPAVPTTALQCRDAGTSLLWGMDYFNAAPQLGAGGAPRWCPINRVDAVTGACRDPLQPNEDPSPAYPDLAGAIIPGITIRASQACASFGGSSTDPTITGMTSTRFDLFFGATSKGSGGAGTPQAARPTSPLTRPLPRQTANIDSWALVID